MVRGVVDKKLLLLHETPATKNPPVQSPGGFFVYDSAAVALSGSFDGLDGLADVGAAEHGEDEVELLE